MSLSGCVEESSTTCCCALLISWLNESCYAFPSLTRSTNSSLEEHKELTNVSVAQLGEMACGLSPLTTE